VRKGGRSGGALDGFSRWNRGEKGKVGAGAGTAQHHTARGGSGVQCCARSSEGRGLAPAAASPNGGGRQLGRVGRARGGGGPVWRVPIGRPRKKGQWAWGERKEVGPTPNE
jgi:hypothetical protein